VVLSACQTGLGKEIRGEGIIGLTRGFMYAGVPRVIVSMWSVNDRATEELMAGFYKKLLKQHMRPSAALREAQIEMWKSKKWSAPFYWGAFIQQGEWR
ncbi:MAG: CHAT domain-containing protein, partial [Candidatus Angelobacter sp.]